MDQNERVEYGQGRLPSGIRSRIVDNNNGAKLHVLEAGFERKRLIRRGVPIKTDTYTVEGNFIWGATARIVRTLLERLGPLL